MYQPQFTITPKITKNIELIAGALGYLRGIHLPPTYQKEYVTTVIADTVHSSTAIEGNSLTKRQVSAVLAGEKIQAYEKDIREVENYHRAVEYISRVAKEENTLITEHMVKTIHKLILSGLDKEKEAGKYRTKPMYVGDYVAPDASEVPTLMKEFIEWVQNPLPKDLSPFLYAGISHYRFVAIHPFIDGNGRTTRILTKLVLMRYGYDITRYFSLESYYNRNRIAYYTALSAVDKYRIGGKEDLTSWLEYFTQGMLIEAKRAQSRVEELQQQSSFITEPVSISDNQKKALMYLKEHKTIKTSHYIAITGLSRKGAYNDLEKLVTTGILKRLGERKSSYYILTTEGLRYV